MKIIYLTYSILMCALFAYPQIPNPSFEVWTDSFPSGWANFQGLTYCISPNSNAHSGSTSAKSEALYSGTCIQSYLITGTPSNQFVPISSKPLELHGWYIFHPLQNENFDANIYFKKNGLIIGTGFFVDYASSAVYNEFVINVTYSLPLQPDSFSIWFSISANPLPCGSYYIVDDLSFQNFVGINEYPQTFILDAFPNPFSESVSIKYNLNAASKIKVKVIDVFGREVSPQIIITPSDIEIKRTNLSS